METTNPTAPREVRHDPQRRRVALSEQNHRNWTTIPGHADGRSMYHFSRLQRFRGPRLLAARLETSWGSRLLDDVIDETDTPGETIAFWAVSRSALVSTSRCAGMENGEVAVKCDNCIEFTEVPTLTWVRAG